MRVGLVLQTVPSSGGAYTFESALQAELLAACKQIGCELVTLSSDCSNKTSGSGVLRYKLTPIRMAISHIRSQPIIFRLLSLVGLGMSNLERVAKREKIDLLLFSSPNHLAAGIQSVPYATTVWDFGHIDLPQASETALGGLWPWRENLYQKTLRRSVTIFCDSDSTARRLTSEYKVDHRRVLKIGLLPNVEMAEPLQYDKPHFIYPAMFWIHKNHEMLVRAFRKFLDDSRQSVYLVLTGSGENEARIRNLVEELGLQGLVKFEGLVPRAKLLQLIKGSIGLVMPSMLGPSNLPPLEATLLGVPVILSDSHSMEDLLSGGYYSEVLNVDAWADAMNSLFQGKIKPGTVNDIKVASLLEESLRRTREQLFPWRAK